MARIKPVDAMKYLGISRESFEGWCDAVQLRAHRYEFSIRTYFLSGEFYALADKPKIIRLKELHGDNWHEFYERYEEVRGFLRNEFEPQPIRTKNYSPKSDSVADFINDLKNEKPNTK